MNDEYTPTGAYVRESYAREKYPDDEKLIELRRQGFDRWRAAHDATVKANAHKEAIDYIDGENYGVRWDLAYQHFGLSGFPSSRPDTETTKLDPLPYEDDQMPSLRLPVGNIGMSTFNPRPEYSQNRADYGITPEEYL